MFKAALAGAIALAAVGIGPVSADTHGQEWRGGPAVGLTESRIAQAKAALRLTPAQERHWPRIASALRSIARQGSDSTMARANGARLVVAAARPLFRTLDADQRQTAIGMVRAMGFGYLASAL